MANPPKDPYHDTHGSMDVSAARPEDATEEDIITHSGQVTHGHAGPFLIGEAMTGGYGSGADILQDCTVSVEKGQIAVIVGPNGAGKSTAMKAVFGMLPKNSLSRQKLRLKLKVYGGAEHPHEAQQPKPYSIVTAKAGA